MEYRPLHITLKSADGLKNVKLFSKMDVYAEVSIAGYPQSKKRTAVDKNSGTSPKWKKNADMEFMVDEPYLTKPGLSLLVQLKAESSFGSDKEVGSVTVPVHDLFGPDFAQEKTIEYQLHTPSGKPKGSVKFSYRFGEKFSHKNAVDPVAAKNQYAPDPVTAYPAAAQPYPMPAGAYYPPPQAGYGAYQPQTSGYGYQGPPPAGYGYGQPKKNKMGMGGGLGLGLGAGLLGGLLVGEMASDVGDAAAYADGYDDAMDMGGGDFDF